MQTAARAAVAAVTLFEPPHQQSRVFPGRNERVTIAGKNLYAGKDSRLGIVLFIPDQNGGHAIRLRRVSGALLEAPGYGRMTLSDAHARGLIRGKSPNAILLCVAGLRGALILDDGREAVFHCPA